MIDIHNHILIDVDDGPKNREDAIQLLKQAKSEGVNEIIATPHHLSPVLIMSVKVLNKIEELRSMEEVQQLESKSILDKKLE